jgi:hypothetical protein
MHAPRKEATGHLASKTHPHADPLTSNFFAWPRLQRQVPSRPEFLMIKKRYPVISIFVAVIWAIFFYPPDKKPVKTPVAQPAASAATAAKPAPRNTAVITRAAN